MENTELQLLETVKELSQQAETPCNIMDIGITLWKMSEEQRADLLAMITFLQARPCGDNGPVYVLGQALHDLNGLKAGFLGLPEGKCFSPRSAGYAKKTA